VIAIRPRQRLTRDPRPDALGEQCGWCPRLVPTISECSGQGAADSQVSADPRRISGPGSGFAGADQGTDVGKGSAGTFPAKRILVTGAGRFHGSRSAASFKPVRVPARAESLLDRDESALHGLQLSAAQAHGPGLDRNSDEPCSADHFRDPRRIRRGLESGFPGRTGDRLSMRRRSSMARALERLPRRGGDEQRASAPGPCSRTAAALRAE